MNIREAMPVLARHEGDWVGQYTLIDLTGTVLDQHDSYLSCQFPATDPQAYFQINRYVWPDGRQEEHHFPGIYQDKKLWFDVERIQGYAWEVDEQTILLRWTYKAIPDAYLYEMIQISPCNNHRARTWHWFRNHQLYQRTLIQEQRIA